MSLDPIGIEQQLAPPNLYHYTDQKGLLGIFDDRKLWATKVQYLNDFKEFNLSVAIAKKQLEHRRNALKNLSTIDQIARIIDHLDGIENVNICAVSFCEEYDLLSQWRGYSSAGGGVSIGFRSSALSGLAAKQNGRLDRCIYDSNIQHEIINKLIDDIINDIEDDSDLSVDLTQFTTTFNTKLIEKGAFFKDKRFQEEKEWRLVTEVKIYKLDEFKFRVGRSMLIPYYEVALDSLRDNISSVTVTIGPCPYPKASEQAITGLSIKHGLYSRFRQGWGPQDFEVRLSQIPYRNW